MKNPQALKWLAAVPIVASTVVLTLPAVPAAAAQGHRFELPEQCNYFPGRTNILACFSQSGDIRQSIGPGNNPVTYVRVTTASTVHQGPSKAGTTIARSKTTQVSSAAAENGRPAVFHLRQLIDADNFAAGLSCAFHIQLETVGDQVQNARTDIKCG